MVEHVIDMLKTERKVNWDFPFQFLCTALAFATVGVWVMATECTSLEALSGKCVKLENTAQGLIRFFDWLELTNVASWFRQVDNWLASEAQFGSSLSSLSLLVLLLISCNILIEHRDYIPTSNAAYAWWLLYFIATYSGGAVWLVTAFGLLIGPVIYRRRHNHYFEWLFISALSIMLVPLDIVARICVFLSKPLDSDDTANTDE